MTSRCRCRRRLSGVERALLPKASHSLSSDALEFERIPTVDSAGCAEGDHLAARRLGTA